MKLPKYIIEIMLITAVLALLLSATCAKAQTTNQIPTYLPPLTWIQVLGKDIESSTNWVVVAGYGHSVSGVGRNIAFAEGGYNFNNYAGVIFGEDYLWGNHQQQFNSLQGGLSLQLPMRPFAFIGVSFLTNIVVTPFVFDQVATSKSSTVANITGGGADFNIVSFWNLELHLGGDYEVRTGDAVWGGKYGLGHIAITRNF